MGTQQAFVILNKTSTVLNIQQKYVPLAVVTEPLPPYLDPVISLAKDAEVTINDTYSLDAHYERQLIISRELRALDTTVITQTVVHDLVGASNCEELVVCPIPYAPFLHVVPKSFLGLALVRSAALDSAEAILVCAGEAISDALLRGAAVVKAAGILVTGTLTAAAAVVTVATTPLVAVTTPVLNALAPPLATLTKPLGYVTTPVSVVTTPLAAAVGKPLQLATSFVPKPNLHALKKPFAALSTPLAKITQPLTPITQPLAPLTAPLAAVVTPLLGVTTILTGDEAPLAAVLTPVIGDGSGDMYVTTPITGDQIQVRIRKDASDGLCKDEVNARNQRFAHIRSVLQIPDESIRPPCIGLVSSGGGMRAMISATGFYAALKELGVLDVATYTATLSGSTWACSKWMDYEKNPFVSYSGTQATDCWSGDVPPQAHDSANYDGLVGITGVPIGFLDGMNILFQAIKHHTLLAGYAALLGHKLGTTGYAKYDIMAEKASTGQYPIPIFTACFPDTPHSFQWQEFTPFEIGSTFLRTFFSMDQLCLDGAAGSPPTLADLMGVWGSAYDAPFAMMFEEANVQLDPIWKQILGNASLKGCGIVNPNYNRVDPTTGQLMPLANQKKIFLRDGGIDTNLPVPALLLRPERTVDLIICLDASADVKERPFHALQQAIPSLQIPTTCQFPYVFQKADDHPQIIYIPVMRNDDFEPGFEPENSCGTFKFVYDKQTTLSLENLAYNWTKLANNQIWDFIRH